MVRRAFRQEVGLPLLDVALATSSCGTFVPELPRNSELALTLNDNYESYGSRREAQPTRRASLLQIAMSDTLGRQSGCKRRPMTAQRAAPGRASEGFEALLDEMSAATARAPAHQIDDEIERWLREVVLALDLDRSTVWERSSADLGFIGTHSWGRPEVPKSCRKTRWQRRSRRG